MSQSDCPAEYATILDLPPHPATDLSGSGSEHIFFGVDDDNVGRNSYKLSLQQITEIITCSLSNCGVSTIVGVASHGLPDLIAGIIPRPFYVDSNGQFVLANSGDASRLPIGCIVEIIDANNVRVQVSGVHHTKTPHGLDPGATYYLQESGGLSVTPGSRYEVPIFTVLDSDALLLTRIDPERVSVPIVRVRFDMSDENYAYYGVERQDATWVISRYRKSDLVKSKVSGVGVGQLDVRWGSRESLTYN